MIRTNVETKQISVYATYTSKEGRAKTRLVSFSHKNLLIDFLVNTYINLRDSLFRMGR